MNLKRKLNLLKKLKEEQDIKEQKLRVGMKPRWNGNTGYSFFRELLELLPKFLFLLFCSKFCNR